jgi:hypothetical protein
VQKYQELGTNEMYSLEKVYTVKITPDNSGDSEIKEDFIALKKEYDDEQLANNQDYILEAEISSMNSVGKVTLKFTEAFFIKVPTNLENYPEIFEIKTTAGKDNPFNYTTEKYSDSLDIYIEWEYPKRATNQNLTVSTKDMYVF